RHLERALGPAQAVGGEGDRAEIEESGEKRRAGAFAPDPRAAVDRDVAQHHLADATGQVDRLRRPQAYPPRIGLDQEERDAPAGPRRYQDHVDPRDALDEELRAGEPVALARRTRP